MDTESHIAVPGSERKPLEGAEKGAPSNPNEIIELTLVLKPKNSIEENLAAYSPDHPEETKRNLHLHPDLSQRKFLTRRQVADLYGANQDDIEKVKKFAGDQGLTIRDDGISRARRTIKVSGTAAQLEATFGVQLNNYAHPDGDYRGREGSVHVPESIVDCIQGVFGLDNRKVGKPHYVVHRDDPVSGERPISYRPNEVANIYNCPEGNGGKQTIALLQFGRGGYYPNKMKEYFEAIDVPPPKIEDISIDGVTNSPNPEDVGGSNDNDFETGLDISVAGGVAPGAKIQVCFAPWTVQGWEDALSHLIHDTKDPPSIISISWGFAEDKDIWTPQAMKAINQLFMLAASMGITVVVASGDDGSRNEVNDGKLHTDFPASSPWVLSVGGTTLNAKDGKVTKERVWNNGPNKASGGGVSNEFARPDYQKDAGVPKASTPIGGRGVPDVAGNADSATGYDVQVLSDSTVLGGTSAAAPLWAGLLARANQNLGHNVGFINPTLYALDPKAGALRPVTGGNNDVAGLGEYSAEPGKVWNACTGLGVPDGKKLLAAFRATKVETITRPKISGTRRERLAIRRQAPPALQAA